MDRFRQGEAGAGKSLAQGFPLVFGSFSQAGERADDRKDDGHSPLLLAGNRGKHRKHGKGDGFYDKMG
jgi:hypothetical protein